MKMDREFDESAWSKLFWLAKHEISGDTNSKEKIVETIDRVCSKIVYMESFNTALEEADFAVAMKVRSWLDWYVLHQELEVGHMPRFLKRFFTAGQIVFLIGVFVLMFLFDRNSSVALDAKVVFSVLGFAGFTLFSRHYNKVLKRIKIKSEVAKNILSSINRIHSNQQERK